MSLGCQMASPPEVGDHLSDPKVPDGISTPVEGTFSVSLGCQTTRPPQVGDHFWCPHGARWDNHPPTRDRIWCP